MAARIIEELEGRSQVQCRRIGSSHQPRIPPTQVGVVICMRSPCSPRFSEAVCAGWVVATYPVPGASSPENAQFRSGQLFSEVRTSTGSLDYHGAVPAEPGQPPA